MKTLFDCVNSVNCVLNNQFNEQNKKCTTPDRWHARKIDITFSLKEKTNAKIRCYPYCWGPRVHGTREHDGAVRWLQYFNHFQGLHSAI